MGWRRQGPEAEHKGLRRGADAVEQNMAYSNYASLSETHLY